MDNVYYIDDLKVYPLLMEPVFKDYLWGGTRLRDEFGKNSSLEKIAESWEVSTQNGNLSKIANGIYSGKSLNDYINSDSERILGINCAKMTEFPVLIKLIDAKDNLSVQVHPNDKYMLKKGALFGKSEMWYIMDCEPGASIILGFNRDITKEEFEERIKNNTLLEAVNKIPVKKGDCYYVEAGTLHAIGKGILIAEIQQNSDVTFRVYDYGRKDANGNSRELHISEAIEVTERTKPHGNYNGINKHMNDGSKLLAKHSNFTVYECDNIKTMTVNDESFCALLFVDGTGSLSYYENGSREQFKFTRGDSVFIPAGFGTFSLAGDFTVLKTVIEK
ncbi:MAG: class I mannose-6-phosphate isomerase [Ruminococcus sp.]|jgi:mannose-6-phosphate isomerase|nr:class I mannose-6-phosphate isomerase [Ruminococcus sp.]